MIDLKNYKYIFLDRDGVINEERPGDYVKNKDEFVFTYKATEAIAILSKMFSHVLIITNQRGIGRGVMSEADLANVHDYMLSEIQKAGGNITRIYFCTDIQPASVNRKPNTGMAFKAQRDFPDINFHESIMVGNSRSDIEFGKKLDMYTVLVGNKYPAGDKIYQIVDAYCENLYKFVSIL